MQSYVGFGAAGLLALALFAFLPTYISKPLASVDPYTNLHAAAGALWLLLVVSQARLIAVQKRALHRTLGRVSFGLAPLFTLSSVLLAHFRFSRMDDTTFAREAYTLYLPLSAALLFASAWTLALLHRGSVQLHARFMACTLLPLLDPLLGRFLAFYVIDLPEFWHYQIVTFSVECAVLLALYLTIQGPSAMRRPFASFAAAYTLVLLLWFIVPRTSGWQAWAEWFRNLPLT